MSVDVKDLLKEALQLPVKERASLAGELLASLDDAAAEDVEAAWAVEIDRRIGEEDAYENVSVEELRQELLEAVKKTRGS